MNSVHLCESRHQTSSGFFIGHIELNMEKTLNALNMQLVKDLINVLSIWQDDDDIACVVLTSKGEKAFCAGGDVKLIYESIEESKGQHNKVAEEFFVNEYFLDYVVHNYQKPVVAYCKGIVFGGGVGLMAGASHRIVTETTMMAMPEISIGLFPDVGGTFFLNRIMNHVGRFVGMTGFRMNAGDVIYCGMADYFLRSDQCSELIELLIDCNWDRNSELNFEHVSHIINKLAATDIPESKLKNNIDNISKMMSGSTVEEVFNVMKASAEENWFKNTWNIVKKASPLSICLTYNQFITGDEFNLKQAFCRELNMVMNCFLFGDFVEGVRALIIDKTNDPVWKNKNLYDVELDKLNGFFEYDWPDNYHPLQYVLDNYDEKIHK